MELATKLGHGMILHTCNLPPGTSILLDSVLLDNIFHMSIMEDIQYL